MNLISLFIVVVAFVSLSSSVPAYEQCGGLEWEPKFRQCDKGLICYARSPYYANCRPPNTCPSHWACTVVENESTIIPPPKIILSHERCDNESYTVCAPGTVCFRRTSDYSECRSKCPAKWQCANDIVHEYGQCGGEGYIGSTRCARGLKCYHLSKWYAQCSRSCPGVGWSC